MQTFALLYVLRHSNLLTLITTSDRYEFEKSHSSNFALDGGVRPKADSQDKKNIARE